MFLGWVETTNQLIFRGYKKDALLQVASPNTTANLVLHRFASQTNAPLVVRDEGFQEEMDRWNTLPANLSG